MAYSVLNSGLKLNAFKATNAGGAGSTPNPLGASTSLAKTTSMGVTAPTPYNPPAPTPVAPKGAITSVAQAQAAGAYDAKNGAGSYAQNGGGTTTPPPVASYTPPASQPTGNINSVTPGAIADQQAQAQTQNQATYPGLVGQLANQQDSPYNQQAMKYLQQLANSNINNNPDYQSQLKAFNDAISNKASFDANLSDAYAANRSNPIPLEFQQGREQVMQLANAQKENTLQGAITQQQQGIGYAQAGQGLIQSALGTAAQGSLSGQGQAQSALSSAAGYSAPQQASPGVTAYNPQNGQSVYGGLGGLKDLSNYQYNTAQAQSLGSQASTVDSALGQLSSQWNNIIPLVKGVNKSGQPLGNMIVKDIQTQLNPSDVAAFNTAYQGLQSTITSLVGNPNIDGANKSILEKYIPQITNRDLKVSDLAGVVEQVSKIGQSISANLTSQAQNYNKGNTDTVIGNNKVDKNINTNVGGSSGGSSGKSGAPAGFAWQP